MDYDDNITEVFSYKDLFEVSLDGIIFHEGSSVLRPTSDIIFPQGQKEIRLEGKGVIEAKSTTAHFTETPPSYRGLWQLQMQLLCTGLKWGIVAVLYQGSRHVVYVYERDESMMKQLIEAGKDFYQRLDGIDWFPVVDGVDASKTYSNAEDELPSINLNTLEDDALEYFQAKQTIRTLESVVKDKEALIMDAMGNHTKAHLSDGEEILFEVTWPMRRTKAKPEKVVAATPEKVERQKSLSLAAKWL